MINERIEIFNIQNRLLPEASTMLNYICPQNSFRSRIKDVIMEGKVHRWMNLIKN